MCPWNRAGFYVRPSPKACPAVFLVALKAWVLTPGSSKGPVGASEGPTLLLVFPDLSQAPSCSKCHQPFSHDAFRLPFGASSLKMRALSRMDKHGMKGRLGDDIISWKAWLLLTSPWFQLSQFVLSHAGHSKVSTEALAEASDPSHAAGEPNSAEVLCAFWGPHRSTWPRCYVR